jgi:capsular polysaccharide transport system permease protein
MHVPATVKSETPLMIQARVLFALVMREMTTRFGRSSGGYVWAVLEPAASVAIMVAVFSQMAHAPPLGRDFGLFYATGYMAFAIWRDVSGVVGGSITANRALLTFPRVTILDTILARFLLQTLTSGLVCALVIGGIVALSRDQARFDLAAALAAFAAGCALGLSLGAFNSLLFACSPTWERTYGVITRPMFIVSGVFFLHDAMPPAIQDVLWWNPLSHVVGLMRVAFYPAYEPSWISPAYLAMWIAAPLVAAALLIRVLRVRILEG